jgi:hypothetical protein
MPKTFPYISRAGARNAAAAAISHTPFLKIIDFFRHKNVADI